MRISDWSSDVCSSDLASTADGRTVGVHGQYRPDKGIDWLLATLARLDRRFERLEIAGRGWAAAPWPRSLLDRYDLVDLGQVPREDLPVTIRSDEHTSELQSLMRISYAVFCLKKKKIDTHTVSKTGKHDTITHR